MNYEQYFILYVSDQKNYHITYSWKKMKKLLFFFTVLLFFACSDSGTNSKYDPPSDHTISKDGHKHKSGLNNPLQNCISCHGEDLRGSSQAPSCYECHGKKW